MTGPSAAKEEHETLIGWTDDEGWAHIYTCHPPMIRLLRRHPHARLLAEHRSEKGELTGVEYEMPTACLAIFIRPRPSTWEKMLRTGPRRRSPRGRSVRQHASESSQIVPIGDGHP